VLDCQNNQLTTLDVSNNKALTELLCTDNQLTSLDVSHNTALITLRCSNNQLTTLDVSHNTALGYLECSNNQLTTLDLTHNSELWYLDCSLNQLTTLDLKNLAQPAPWIILSPQRSDVVIPVVKRDAAYEVDAAAFLGRFNARVDGQLLDADGKVKLFKFPKLATYIFEVDSSVLTDKQKTMRVETKNFQMHQV
ncbi:MAG: hypothetical protein RSA89_06560, partial [Raoultibacter sp.]